MARYHRSTYNTGGVSFHSIQDLSIRYELHSPQERGAVTVPNLRYECTVKWWRTCPLCCLRLQVSSLGWGRGRTQHDGILMTLRSGVGLDILKRRFNDFLKRVQGHSMTFKGLGCQIHASIEEIEGCTQSFFSIRKSQYDWPTTNTFGTDGTNFPCIEDYLCFSPRNMSIAIFLSLYIHGSWTSQTIWDKKWSLTE